MNRQERRKLRRDKNAYANHLESKKILNNFIKDVTGLDSRDVYNILYDKHKIIWIEFCKKTTYNKDYFELSFFMDFDRIKEFEETKDFTDEQVITGIIGRYRQISDYKQMPYIKPKEEKTE